MTEPLPHGFARLDVPLSQWNILEGLSRIPRGRWPNTAVVLRPEGVEIMSRTELASWFRKNGMSRMARRVEKVHVPSLRVLVWAEGDDDSELLVCKPPGWLAEDEASAALPQHTALLLTYQACAR
jgi:hypothetical protein